MKNIVVIAPHPDDETLGCGGTILKYIKQGHKVYWLIVTSGKDSTIFPTVNISAYNSNITKVSSLYGFTEVIKLDLPVVRLDTIPEHTIYDSIATLMKSIKPEIVYIPNLNDIHSDHKIVSNIMISCTKDFRFPFIKKVYMYETISETDYSPALQGMAFVPNSFVDITDYIEKKMGIMDAYTTEVMPSPHPRSSHAIKALAAYRGARISVLYAEAFMLIFEKE